MKIFKWFIDILRKKENELSKQGKMTMKIRELIFTLPVLITTFLFWDFSKRQEREGGYQKRV